MILLVDDDVCYLRVIPHMLKMQDLEVSTAKHTSEAQECLNKNANIQTIILNLHMRDGDGLNFLKWLETTYTKIPLLILSNPNRDNFTSVSHNHDYSILEIPFNGHDLTDALKQLI
jgi:DNA-binding NtrC family response regulator